MTTTKENDMREIIKPSDWSNGNSDYPMPDFFAWAEIPGQGDFRASISYVAFVTDFTIYLYASDDDIEYHLEAVGQKGMLDLEYFLSILDLHSPRDAVMRIGVRP